MSITCTNYDEQTTDDVDDLATDDVDVDDVDVGDPGDPDNSDMDPATCIRIFVDGCAGISTTEFNMRGTYEIVDVTPDSMCGDKEWAYFNPTTGFYLYYVDAHDEWLGSRSCGANVAYVGGAARGWCRW
jgi:hypothetical protein